MIHAHVQGSLSASHLAKVRRNAGPQVTVACGDEPDPLTNVWVNGPWDAESIRSLTELKAVVLTWAGASRPILDAVKAAPGVSLHNLHHNDAATGETAVALMMAVAKRLVPRDRALREGIWEDRFGGQDGLLLSGSRALLLGYGAIGKKIARACRGLGMRVQAVRRQRRDGDPSWVFGIEDLHKLLPKADFLLCSLPGTPETTGLMGETEIRLLPKGSVVVNVGRGPVFDEDALYNALADGHLAGAGIDVWYVYPKGPDEPTFPGNRPFHLLPNVVMSPHRGGNAKGIDSFRFAALGKLLRKFAEGDWEANRIDLDRGY